ncbi:MAG: ABC transporter ATP-binding protein [Actinobacteria bacterium]|nr:ABC transporter ATP-binding protein [Actinomycetota bacterium]
MSLLELRDLSITYHTSGGPVPAVRGVDLVIEPGGTVGLAGESGCGKSTIAASILRLLPAGTTVGGQVLLEGEDVYQMRPGQLRAARWTSAAIVFQGALHSLNPVHRVGAQIEEAILLHSKIGRAAEKARVADLLERVGIPASRAARYPHQMSGGQRQRVLIALALACEPKLLIADEPTTALDVMVQAQVLDLLAELQRERQLAMLFITHDLSVLTHACRRLAIMYAGRIVEEGASEDLFQHPEHPYSRALANAFPTIGDPASRMNPSGLAGDPPDPTDLPTGCTFHPRCPLAVDECSTIDIQLVRASAGRRAACVHVRPFDD